MKRRHCGATLVLLLPLAARAGAAVIGVRVWPAADYTRLTIESDSALVARHFVSPGAEHLVIDVDGIDLDTRLRELVGQARPDDPYIATLRAAQSRPGTVRLVLDLKQPVAPQQFSLAPVAAYRHRLVFDLYPLREPPDPLLALVRDKEAAAAQAVQDALGELIARVENGRPGLPSPSTSGSSSAPPSPSASPAPSASTLPGRLPSPTPSPPPKPLPVPPPPSRAPPSLAERRSAERLVIVAIDPGHGGEDPGAIGPTGLREKDVVLAIALQLRDTLDAVPAMRALLTRDGDFFVPLAERVRKARRVQADLFVSIHADAFLRPEARGASVFALSARGATSSAARWMAERENAADAVGGVNVDAVQDREVLRAMADMSTAAQIRDSLKLGGEVLTRIGRVGRLHKGSVEQAGFAVLKAPDVPSILVETAFISNPDEEERLRDPAWQRQLVEALGAGVQRYFAANPPLARRRSL